MMMMYSRVLVDSMNSRWIDTTLSISRRDIDYFSMFLLTAVFLKVTIIIILFYVKNKNGDLDPTLARWMTLNIALSSYRRSIYC